MKIAPARVAAFDVLLRIESEEALSSSLLPRYESELSPLDAALTHELVLGVLRTQITLDNYLSLYTDIRRFDTEVLIALRLGIYQLYYLDKVAMHAVVNDGVELVKRARKRSATGLVNAVLRKAAKKRGMPDFSDEIGELEHETSHPRALLARWADAWGFERARAIAVANNLKPRRAFRHTSRGRESRVDLSSYAPSSDVEGCYFAERADERIRTLADDGQIYFQDEGSQLIAASVYLEKGEKFLDVCAAPGGKCTSVSARFPNAFVIGGDLTARRVDTLKRIVEAHQASVHVVRHNAFTSLPYAAAAFDHVLVDAPCSGTGTIRHNPEIRYRISADAITRFSETQRSILETAAEAVVQGGTLHYSTCSLEPEENEAVVRAFLARHSSFELVRPSVPDRFVNADLTARTWPGIDDMDGFFLACMRRRRD